MTTQYDNVSAKSVARVSADLDELTNPGNSKLPTGPQAQESFLRLSAACYFVGREVAQRCALQLPGLLDLYLDRALLVVNGQRAGALGFYAPEKWAYNEQPFDEIHVNIGHGVYAGSSTAARQGDVVIIDPTSSNPIGFNPLNAGERDPSVTADTLLATFESLFKENWGIRTADVLSAAFLTLARLDGANLLWLHPMLTNPVFRKKLLKENTDPLGTDAFWRQYDAKKPDAQAVEIAPVLNKIRQLILRPGLRAVLGQKMPRFDIGDLFSKQRIVIVNLNSGLLGSDAAKLLGTLLLGQLWSRLLARQALPKARRHMVGVYIDEVHDFIAGLPGDLADALAQARSLGAGFVLAHQYRSQLSPAMVQAVEANTRNKIYFGMNGLDAAATAKLMPGLEQQDLMLLPKYHAYANVMQDGDSTGWMSVRTLPPTPTQQHAADAYAASQERYGVPAEQTERDLVQLIYPDTPDLGAEADDVSAPVGRVKR